MRGLGSSFILRRVKMEIRNVTYKKDGSFESMIYIKTAEKSDPLIAEKEELDMNFDRDGKMNVLCGMIESAKKDYIRGYCYLKKMFKRIPTEDEYQKWAMRYNGAYKSDSVKTQMNNCDNFYDAKRFVESDPYELFDDEPETIFHAWDGFAEEKFKDFVFSVRGMKIPSYKLY